PLPLTQFATMDGTLQIAARAVRLTDVTFTDALIQATLRDGGLTVSQLDIVAPRGRLDGTLKVLPTDRGADVHFTFGGKDLGLNLGGDPTDLVQAVIFDVDVDLSGHGATIRELAASLSGRASLESDGGRIRNRGISLYTGFGGELLSALNPMAKEIPYTQITCARVSFEATDGRFETSPTIVVQTERINLISKGAIDLKTEKIDFTFTSKPRKRLSISASELINPYLRVAGTLGKPRLTMNRRGTAVSATAAVATAGLSILARAAWDRTFRKKDPCE
ncbi:MAG: AsmA-like C-terminal region-containing protein, partial [Pseudomonadales bacterium]